MLSGSEDFTSESYLIGSEKRRIEVLLDPLYFDKLFDFANKLLASKPIEPVVETQAISVEAQLITQLGSRGLRSAIELALNAEDVFEPDEDTSDEEPLADDPLLSSTYTDDYGETRRQGGKAILLNNDSPFRFPEMFSGEMDRSAILRTEQLGETLMDDMFKTLGQDAYVMAERMKNAETNEEQIAIMEWLDGRLNTMAATYEDQANEGLMDTYSSDPKNMPKSFTYHPVRISGKVIGTYPEHQLSPTCFGISIAAAGFLKRAGIDFLHAGVMSSRTDQRVGQTLNLIATLPLAVTEQTGIEFPDKFMHRNEQGVSHLLDGLNVDIGYHHAVYARLKNGAWMQFDPNYRRTIEINFEDTSEKLTKAHELLEELHHVSPGLEITQGLEFFKTIPGRFEDMLADIDQSATPNQAEAVNFLLGLDADSESLPTKLYEVFVEPVFNPENITTEEGRDSLNYVLEFFEDRIIHEREPLLYEMFSNVLNAYVLDGMAIDQYIQRCKTDPSFLANAASDMRAVPYMMMPALSMDLLHADPINFGVHAHVELGLPAARIGFAALNDVAQFYDTSPSPTFWLSNWPSLQPVTEAFYTNPSNSETQRAILQNNLGALFKRRLLYNVTYAKVSNIQSEFEPQEENHGQRQEEVQRGQDQ